MEIRCLAHEPLCFYIYGKHLQACMSAKEEELCSWDTRGENECERKREGKRGRKAIGEPC